MGAMWMGLGLWLIGCSGPDTQTDAEWYLSAVTAPSEASGTALCAPITDKRLRGDCQVARSAITLTIDSSTAEIAAVCDAIEDDMWRSECWFMASDARAVIGPEVWVACEKTGRYRKFCFEHALKREIEAVELPLGAEDAGIAEIAALIHRYFMGETDTVKQGRFTRMITRRISSRWGGDIDFDPALCHPLTEGLCSFAYLHSVAEDPAIIADVCALTQRTTETVQAQGGVGWSPPGAAIAEAVWSDLCAPPPSDGTRTPRGLPRKYYLPLPLPVVP